MNAKQLNKIGFITKKSFKHDEFHTEIFEKGAIKVFRTTSSMKGMELSIDVEVEETNSLSMTVGELVQLDKIINKK